MASKLDICNRALAKLGQNPITSMAGTDKVSVACNNAFEPVKDSILRSHPWNVTMTRTKLTGATTTDIPEYDYQYTLPSDLIKIIQIYMPAWKDWAREGNLLLTNEGPDIYLRYQKNLTYVTDTEQTDFDAMLIEVIAAKLSYELAETITQSNTKKAEAKTDYMEIMREAKKNDAQEGSSASFEVDDWVKVRY